MELKKLFENDQFDKVIEKFNEINNKSEKDYIITAIASYKIQNTNKAISVLKQLLNISPNNMDALFNLSSIYHENKNWNKLKETASKYYQKDPNNWEINDMLFDLMFFEGHFDKAFTYLNKSFENVPKEYKEYLKEKIKEYENKIGERKKLPKLAFICLKGLDNFINDIMQNLSDSYWVRKFIITRNEEVYKAIDWADIVWLEWANETAIIGSNYGNIKNKPTIIRLHRYEAFAQYPKKINWSNVDKLILVSDHIKDVIKMYMPNIEKMVDIETIHNGVAVNDMEFKKREKGFNIAWVAIVSYRKNPLMMLQIIKKLVDKDKRYKVHMAGTMQGLEYEVHLKHIINEMNIKDNVIFYGWVDNMNEWWKDKNYLLSTSIHEGHPCNIIEGMARGIKPIIHNYFGSKDQWPNNLIFNTVDEAVNLILEDKYNSEEYRKFVADMYPLENQIKKIKNAINSIKKNAIEKKENQQSQVSMNRKVVNNGFKHHNNSFVEKLRSYLSGETISTLQMNFKEKRPLYYRMDFLKKISMGKKIIHLGFTDHKNLIKEKMENNTWLHEILTKNANKCVGIDINCEAVDFVKTLGFTDSYCLDITKEIPEIVKKDHWDYIILGELIEHIQNPIPFLQAIKTNLGEYVNEIIITTPNVFRIENIYLSQNGIESINSDHRYWFSPYTLMKIAFEAEIEIKNLVFAESYKIPQDKNLKLKEENQILRDTLILIGKL